jgi:uncharacterized protein (TIGR03083 family)
MTSGWATELRPRDTTKLFRPLLRELIALLRSLEPDDWNHPTLAGDWKVRDVAAHLLDGDLRKLSACRDGRRLAPESPIRTNQDLARFIRDQNAAGVAFGARLSTRVLVDLLEATGERIADFFSQLPLNETAAFAVSWAGEAQSANWMDIGREYTERWHHQMQIRDALDEPRLLEPSWMDPLLEFSVRSLPVAYGGLRVPQGSVATLEVHGPTSGLFSAVREESRWRVVRGAPPSPGAWVRVATDDIWRIFYNAVKSPGLIHRLDVRGNWDLALPLLNARSVIV